MMTPAERIADRDDLAEMVERKEQRIQKLEQTLRDIEEWCGHRGPLDAGDLSNRLCDIAFTAQQALKAESRP